jgi:translocation and assembly module TamB
MARRVLLTVVGAVAALVLAAVVFAGVVLATAPGHRLLRRWLVSTLEGQVDGTVHIGSVGGALWQTADLRDITLATRDGRPVIRAERLQVSFALIDLVRGRYRFSRVTLVRPVMTLERGPDGRLNLERLFRLPHHDTTPGGRRPFVELRDVAIGDGTVILRERHSPPTERSATGLTLTLSRLRVSDPDSSGVSAVIRSLSVRLSHPSLVLERLDGRAVLDGDSVRFALDHVRLPGTAASVKGTVRWGGAHLAADVSARADRLAFADLRGVLGGLPASGGGRLDLQVRLPGNGATEVLVEHANVHSGRSSVTGQLRVTTGLRGGVSVRDADLTLQPLDLEALAPYVRVLPVHGLVRGRVRGGGALTDLLVDADVAWTDVDAPRSPVNQVSASGHFALGGPDEIAFHALTLRRGEFDFGTIERFVPGVGLDGRLRAEGRLDGPWRRSVFTGRLTHLGAPDLASSGRGTVRLDLRDSARVDADLDMDSLSLDLLRRTYPQIPMTGLVSGRISLHGPVAALGLSVALRAGGGALTAAGTVGTGEALVHVSVAGTFDSLDLARVRRGLPPTVLRGQWSADLLVPRRDSTALTTGVVRVVVQPSWVTGLAVQGGAASLRLTSQRLEVDSVRLETAAGPMSVVGTLGRAGGASSGLDVSVRTDTLAYLEPLLRWVATSRGDTGAVRLDGSGYVRGRITGGADGWEVNGELAVESVDFAGGVARALRVHGRVGRRGREMTLGLTVAADTLGWGGLSYAPIGITAAGRVDSLHVAFTAGFGTMSAVRGEALALQDSVRRTLRVSALELDLPVRRWQLVRPVTVAMDSEAITIDTLELRPEHGGGLVRAEGRLPLAGVGDFLVRADSVPVLDVYTLAERDTAGIGGAIDLAARIAGPAASPTMEMSVALVDAHVGEYRAPLIQALVRYGDGLLTLKGGLWRDTVRVVALSGSLPLDLALTPVARRRLPGPLSLVAVTDSVDLALLDPLIDVFSGMSGALRADVRVTGTWDQQRVAGFAEVRSGAMTVPALGARYTDMDVRLDLRDSVITVTRATIRAGGTLQVSGAVRLEHGASLDLVLHAREFAAFDLRSFGGITGTGELTLRGPVFGATLAGRLRVDRGYLKFADLVEKRIVNLDDPEFRALVDSNLALASNLGPEVQAVFMDSLRIAGLVLQMGPDVWLRSTEANIQLDGEFVVDKTIENRLPRYRLDGALRAVRGSYRLVLGPVNSPFQVGKDFRVTRGSVRFYGTPDFNPELDIAAEHQLRTVAGSPLTVRVLIGGTLLFPRLRLESDQRPPLTETEIVSYLMFGMSPSQLTQAGAGGDRQSALLQTTLSGVAGGVGQSLISDLGLPLDYLTIVPGTRRPNDALGLSTARVGAGVQIGDRTFLTLTAGLCEVVTSQLIGASVEYRIGRPWTASAAFEPLIRECGIATGLSGLSSRYQLSFDLFWQQGIR